MTILSFDGLFTRAMTFELNQQLTNGRVGKISQPYPNEVILTIRAQRHNFPLLLSAHPSYARIQITQIPFKNPAVPTNFTMSLRKHLEGAKLLKIEQLANDRVLYLNFATRNELGDELPIQLSIEIMGRYSNIILINQKQQQIIDTIKHIGPLQNRYRTLLPGANYVQPPQQNKLDPFVTSNNQYQQLVVRYPNREVLAKQLQQTYQGFAKEHALYFADQLHRSDQSVTQSWQQTLQRVKQPTPCIVKPENARQPFFTYLPFSASSTIQQAATLSEILDSYYQQKANRDRVQQLASQLINIVQNNLHKNKKKIKKLQQTLNASKHADQYRIKGELLTTYLNQVKRGMTSIELENYYDNQKLLQITLSPNLTPSKNAQKYFKKYQKLKTAVTFVNEQLAKAQEEVAYLEEIQSEIELAAPEDLPEIKLELQQQGYLQQQKNLKKNKPRQSASHPAVFYSSDQTKISVGKNNLQNDRLTLKTASKNDIWLHAKNVPGSHVIIHDPDPSQQTLLEAANLAAYFSKSRQSATVPVDYVTVKKIRKPNGARPGFVIYEGQKTLFVTPESQLVKKLAAKNHK